MAGYYCNLRIFKGKAPSTKSQDPRNTNFRNQDPCRKYNSKAPNDKIQAPEIKSPRPCPRFQRSGI
jgi:hypothetical protein